MKKARGTGWKRLELLDEKKFVVWDQKKGQILFNFEITEFWGHGIWMGPNINPNPSQLDEL
jgi:hypothetical protein